MVWALLPHTLGLALVDRAWGGGEQEATGPLPTGSWVEQRLATLWRPWEVAVAPHVAQDTCARTWLTQIGSRSQGD